MPDTDALPGLDPAYQQYQYGDAEKLRIRYESHARFSTNPVPFRAWLIDRLEVEPGMLVLDIGCGPGAYHPALARLGARIVGADMSRGMVTDVCDQAARMHLDAAATQASAERLPFAGAAFDRVMANHMMYYVPDQTMAMREMRRVLRRGGLIVMSTNASDNNARLHVLHQQAALELGYRPIGEQTSRFTLDDLPLVQDALPGAEVHSREDNFDFPTADDAVRYYASAAVDMLEGAPADGSHRARLAARVRELIADIIEREGSFVVPKNAGCFTWRNA